jgi:hypothetical protein
MKIFHFSYFADFLFLIFQKDNFDDKKRQKPNFF